MQLSSLDGLDAGLTGTRGGKSLGYSSPPMIDKGLIGRGDSM